MTNQTDDTWNITAKLVAEDDRLSFFPTYFGKYFMAGEKLLYAHASKFVKDYDGGYWNFYTLSNGGFFCALATDEVQHLVIADNYFSETMSAEAAGIALTLFVLGRLLSALIPDSEIVRFNDLHYRLREFVYYHPEKEAILRAID